MPTYRQSIDLPQSPEVAFRWHTRPGAFERLTPPFEDVRVVERTGGMDDGGTVTLAVKKAGISVTWKLRRTFG